MDVSCIIIIYSLKNYEQKGVCKVYQFARAAVTKYHTLGEQNNRK